MARLDDDLIIRLLVAGYNATRAAAELGCSPSAIYARTRDPLFNARVQEARGQAFAELAAKAPEMIAKSLALFDEFADDGLKADRDRMTASKLRAELAGQVHEFAAVAPRLAALEAALAEHNIDLPLAIREGGAE